MPRDAPQEKKRPSKSRRMRRDTGIGDRSMTQPGTGNRPARTAKGHARQDPISGVAPPPGAEQG